MELVSADASASGRPHFTEYLSKYLQENVLPLKVTLNHVHPGSRDAGPCTSVIRLSWQHLGLNSPVSFEPGDLLGVLPENSNDMVSKLLKRLHLDSNFTSFVVQRLMIQKKTLTMEGPREEWVPYENLPPATIYEWFKKFLDITTPPTQLLLSEVSTYATNQTEKENLNLLSQDVGVYEQWKHSNRPTILSFLEAFPSLSIPPEAIISKIPLMKPRYYSVSSCLSMSLPTSVDLVVRVVKFTTKDGSSRNGLCSMYLNEAAVGTIVNAFFRREPGFHLPHDPSDPIILVAPDTDILPFKSFWMHRKELMKVKQRLGTATLFGGNPTNREATIDTEGQTERQLSLKIGGIEVPIEYLSKADKYVTPDRVIVDDKTTKKIFHYKQGMKQMMIDVNARRIYEKLYHGPGHIYVSGDFALANDVKSAVVSIFQRYGYMTENWAVSAVESLIKNGRYHEEIFGNTVGALNTHLVPGHLV